MIPSYFDIYLSDTSILDGSKDMLILDADRFPRAGVYDNILKNYIYGNTYETLGIISGLKCSGKKTCIRQLASSLPNSVLIHINEDNPFYNDEYYLPTNPITDICKYFFDKGINNFFIENITLAPILIENTFYFCENFSGKRKFVLTGDNNYIFYLAQIRDFISSMEIYFTNNIYCKIDKKYIEDAIINNIITAIKDKKEDEYGFDFMALYKLYTRNRLDYSMKSIFFIKKDIRFSYNDTLLDVSRDFLEEGEKIC